MTKYRGKRFFFRPYQKCAQYEDVAKIKSNCTTAAYRNAPRTSVRTFNVPRARTNVNASLDTRDICVDKVSTKFLYRLNRRTMVFFSKKRTRTDVVGFRKLAVSRTYVVAKCRQTE